MFEISSRQGLPIRGDVDAPRNARALVVIVHGHEADKDWGFYPWLAEQLCDSGLAVVRFTMSTETYSLQVHDLVDVIAYARSRFRGLPLFLLGHSLGGAVALFAATGIEDLRGVITWSAISRGSDIDLVGSVSLLRVPLLAIHGGSDTHVSPEESRRIVSGARDASLVVIDGASHTYNAIHPLVYVPRALEYAARVSAQFVSAYS